jgi:hypothetical protein
MTAKILFLFTFILITSCYAKVWRVDQNATNHPDYTNLQSAIDNAQAKDTIYVAGYPTSYGSININKEIVLFGTGYFLSQNSAQAYPHSSQLDYVEFQSGGGYAIICGFEIHAIKIGCDNVTIRRNYIRGYDPNLIDFLGYHVNVLIEQNYLDLNGGIVYENISTSNSDNVIIRNNYIRNSSSAFGIRAGGITIIYNNVIDCNLYFLNSQFYNNIIVNCSYYNSGGSLLKNNFNQYGGIGTQVDFSTVFVPTGTIDSKWKLKEGSVVKNAGLYGEDCGMFGGSDPYVLSGIPPIPTIYEATVPQTASEEEGLKVTIKAKTNTSGTTQQEGITVNRPKTNSITIPQKESIKEISKAKTSK